MKITKNNYEIILWINFLLYIYLPAIDKITLKKGDMCEISVAVTYLFQLIILCISSLFLVSCQSGHDITFNYNITFIETKAHLFQI